ncbi:F-box/FBD/LRR-repeat protein [Rhynchospora pubera]|uniref:F-box/FBD/LRR-repeat protein n=1 Tax=Rhynchospora pubera TaxID=906938 RepID=A0AAV8H5G4_9POAL|nr:F-box/FBD/LRR-repeat protein [Rhynchospora pubera]
MKMVKFVDKLLSFHHGSISKFVIADVIELNNKALNRWMRVLSRKGIGKIKIPAQELYGRKKWKVPPVFWNLKCLKEVVLEHCVIKLPQAFEGFKLLKSLSLKQLDISDNDLTNLIASCPLLENLVLSIARSGMNIIIDALKLKHLRFSCYYFKHVNLRAPSAVKAVLYLSTDLLSPFGSNLTDLLNCLPKLEILELRSPSILRYLSYGCDLELSIKFDHLKSLYIHMNFGYQREAAVVHQLFRRAPNLEELSVSTLPKSYDIGSNLEKWDQSIVFEHLKFVKIRGLFKSNPNQLLRDKLCRAAHLTVRKI